MSSKTYKAKTCAYCGVPGASTTADHVFAREFFLTERRSNIPKVPACKACNEDKARLEFYLTGVLPFGGRHPDARVNLSTMLPKRLAKNASLGPVLRAGMSPVWVPDPSGLLLRTAGPRCAACHQPSARPLLLLCAWSSAPPWMSAYAS